MPRYLSDNAKEGCSRDLSDLAFLKDNLAMNKVDIGVVQPHTALGVPSKGYFVHIDAKGGDRSVWFLSFHKAEGAIAPDLTEFHGEFRVPIYNLNTKLQPKTRTVEEHVTAWTALMRQIESKYNKHSSDLSLSLTGYVKQLKAWLHELCGLP